MTTLIPVIVLGTIAAAGATGGSSIIAGLIGIYLLLKFCNGLDAKDIADETKRKEKRHHRRSRR